MTLSRAGQEIVRETDADGRIADFGEPVAGGTYQLSFDVAGYYKKKGGAFIQRATFEFEITDAGRGRRYHIPLLMSPFACSTYRGS